MHCGAVIPAAGSSTRFSDGDKTMLMLSGRPVLQRVLDVVTRSEMVEEVVIVVSDANQLPVLELITGMQPELPVSVVMGGATRRESVRAGVEALGEQCDLVLIHDAARPLVSTSLVTRMIQAGEAYGAAIPGVPVSDTIKQINTDKVVRTLDRRELIAVQTPQVFRRDWLVDSYRDTDPACEATDEAAILEAAGYPVHVVQGEPSNIKVTTPSDAIVADALLAARGSEA